jgi:hypothetical protein
MSGWQVMVVGGARIGKVPCTGGDFAGSLTHRGAAGAVERSRECWWWRQVRML